MTNDPQKNADDMGKTPPSAPPPPAQQKSNEFNASIAESGKKKDTNAVSAPAPIMNPKKGFFQHLFGSSKKEEKKQNTSKQKDAANNIYAKLFQTEAKTENALMETITSHVESKQKLQEAQEEKKQSTQEKAIPQLLFKKPPAGKKETDAVVSKIIRWEYGFFIVSCIFIIAASAFFYTQLDTENMVLSVFGIENMGQKNKNMKNEVETLRQEIQDAEMTITNLASSETKKKYSDVMNVIKKNRISWSDILRHIEEVTNQLSPSYYNDIQYKAFAFQHEKRFVNVSVELKNEKVFTLISDLIDAFENSEYFENVSFTKFTKSKIKESDEFQSGINMSFQYTEKNMDKKDALNMNQ